VWFGCQRKTVSDLLASWQDGRLTREVAQMASRISMPLIIVEGRMQFSNEGELIGKGWGNRVTLQQWRGLQFTLASRGIMVMHTATIADTAELIRQCVAWTSKATHTSVTARPKLVDSAWGQPNNRDWGVYLLQSFDGVGAGLAGDIFDHFGKVPIRWEVTREEMLAVKGMGPKRVDKMLAVLA
jgi:ERCC4-type nuclease